LDDQNPDKPGMKVDARASELFAQSVLCDHGGVGEEGGFEATAVLDSNTNRGSGSRRLMDVTSCILASEVHMSAL
jgi:hypothetical protein